VEHVLHPIGGIEDASNHAAARSCERAEEHRLPFLLDELSLTEKCVFADGSFVERPGIFREAQCRISPE